MSVRLDLGGLSTYLRESLDNYEDDEYTAEQIEEIATIVYAQAVRILRKTNVDDPLLTDAATAFIGLLRVYAPTFRRTYGEQAATAE